MPVLHLGIAGLPIVHEESRVWKDLPHIQRSEEIDDKYPVPTGAMWIDPCYEYRPSMDARTIMAADLPTAILFGFSAGECSRGLSQFWFKNLHQRVELKTRVVVLEGLIALAIFVQWLLIGHWLDQGRKLGKRMRRWVVPIAIITIAATLMVPTTFFSWQSLRSANELLSLCAFLSWLALGVMLFGSFVSWGARKIHPGHNESLVLSEQKDRARP